MLCDRCSAIFREPRFSRYSRLVVSPKTAEADLQPLHANPSSLAAALDHGCGVCCRLVENLSSRKPSRILSDSKLCPEVDQDSFSMRYRLAFETPKRTVISCYCVLTAKVSGKAVKESAWVDLYLSFEQAPLVNAPTVDAENGVATKSMDVIMSWIKDCHENHRLCRRETAPSLERQFARILDVGDTLDAPDIKLCPSELVAADLPYMTLSHCWGNAMSEVPILTAAMYETYLLGLAVVDLPRTFQDAIMVTRRLGIRYLWIDALCIIQDSKKDWLNHSALMGEVYRGSYLNLAATKADSPSGGLFTRRNPALLNPVRLELSFKFPYRPLLSQGQDTSPEWLKLEEPATLVHLSPAADVGHSQSEIDLNTRLGNHNGAFAVGGVNFAHSAKNVSLIGTVLHAELRTISGVWKQGSFDLSSLKEVSSHPKGEPRHLRLERSSVLVVSSPNQHIEYTEFRIDLDQSLGNNNGSFDLHGKNFSSSMLNPTISGTILRARLKNVQGEWIESSIDLSTFVRRAVDGSLLVDKLNERRAAVFYDVGWDFYRTWSTQVSAAPLCRRGWVMQERLLAPRVVHFGKKQLFWECVQAQRLEERPDVKIDNQQAMARSSRLDMKTWDVLSIDVARDPPPRELSLNYIWASVKAMYGRSDVPFKKDDLARDRALLVRAKEMCYGTDRWTPTHPLIKYWSIILNSYSGARLTYADDRLVAIAGVARLLFERTQISYAAGLWRHQTPRQMLWQVMNQTKPHTVHADKYVAPSWSWASQANLISSIGTRLDPVLETKGAMDLIKILSVDVEGVADNDPMAFGKVRQARMRIRGRLLPISLDLKAWPEGATRKKELIQFWSGSTPDPPTGETFLVPVLFTRWNERLPSGTANSLLLESTSEKGVFRRVGVARLSSLCSLKHIVSQLYESPSSHHEDEDDDATSEGEALEEDTVPMFTSATSHGIVPNPQQESMDRHIDIFSGDKIQTALASISDRVKGKVAQGQMGGGNKPKMSPEAALQKINALSSLTHSVFSQVPGKPSEKIQLNQQEMQRDMAELVPNSNITVVQRQNQWTRKHVPKLEPKQAVGPHFYLDYAEDDKDVVRFGHFEFDII